MGSDPLDSSLVMGRTVLILKDQIFHQIIDPKHVYQLSGSFSLEY